MATHVWRLKEYLQEKGIQEIPWIYHAVFFSNPDAHLPVSQDANSPVFHSDQHLLNFFQQSMRQQKTNRFVTKEIQHILWSL